MIYEWVMDVPMIWGLRIFEETYCVESKFEFLYPSLSMSLSTALWLDLWRLVDLGCI